MTEFQQELDQKCLQIEEAGHQLHLILDQLSSKLNKYNDRIEEITNQVRDYHFRNNPEWWNDANVDLLLIDFKKPIKEKFGKYVDYTTSTTYNLKMEHNEIGFQYDEIKDTSMETNLNSLLDKFVAEEEEISAKELFDVVIPDLINHDMKINLSNFKNILDKLSMKSEGKFKYQLSKSDDDEKLRIVYQDDKVMREVKEYVVKDLLSPANPKYYEIGLVMMNDEGKLISEYEQLIKEKRELINRLNEVGARLNQSMPSGILSFMFKAYINRYNQAYIESRQLIDRKKKYDIQRVEIHNLIEQMEKTGYLNSDELDNLKGIENRSNEELNQLLEEIKARKKLIENFVRSPVIKDFKKVMRESLNMFCQICFQNNINRSLKCGHLFCSDCLTKMKKGGNITCAFCNQISSTVNCGRCDLNSIRNIYLSSGGTK